MHNDNFGSPESRPQYSIAANLIRFTGAGVMLLGIAIVLKVVFVAWELIDNHDRVAAFAAEVEKHSNLDAFANAMLQTASQAARDLSESQSAAVQAGDPSAEIEITPPLTIAYFASWVLLLFLLALIARIGSWAIFTGGKLALYSAERDRQIKELLRELIIEVRRPAPGGFGGQRQN